MTRWAGWSSQLTYTTIVKGLLLVERHPLPSFWPLTLTCPDTRVVTSSPQLPTFDPYMPRYKGPSDRPILVSLTTREHALMHLLIFTSLMESFSLPQSVRNSFFGPPLLIIIIPSLIYISSHHMRGLKHSKPKH